MYARLEKICGGLTIEGSHQQCHYIDSVTEIYLWQTFQNDVHLMWINWDSSKSTTIFDGKIQNDEMKAQNPEETERAH